MKRRTTLNLVAQGKRVKVVDFISAGRRLGARVVRAHGVESCISNKDFAPVFSEGMGINAFRRIQEMGIIKGEVIRVNRNSGFGPLEIGIRDTCLAIGRGIASKIVVEIEDE